MIFNSRKDEYETIKGATSFYSLCTPFEGQFIPCGPYSLVTLLVPHYDTEKDTLKLARFTTALTVDDDGLCLSEFSVSTPRTHLSTIAKELLKPLFSTMYHDGYPTLDSLAKLADSAFMLNLDSLITDDLVEPFLPDVQADLLQKEFPNAQPGQYYDTIAQGSCTAARIFTRDDLELYLLSGCSLMRAPNTRSFGVSDVTAGIIIEFTEQDGYVIREGKYKGLVVRFNNTIFPSKINKLVSAGGAPVNSPVSYSGPNSKMLLAVDLLKLYRDNGAGFLNSTENPYDITGAYPKTLTID